MRTAQNDLDHVDRAILCLLQEDGRMANVDLAEAVLLVLLLLGPSNSHQKLLTLFRMAYTLRGSLINRESVLQTWTQISKQVVETR